MTHPWVARIGRLIGAVAILFLLGDALDTLPLTRTVTSALAVERGDRLDINSATEDQLKALPGIGDVLAKRIIEKRPYRRKDELVTRKVIPEATYDRIKDQIVAKQ